MDFEELEIRVGRLNSAFDENTVKAINKNVTARNWLIGFYIVNYEQNGKDRASYGEKTLQMLSERLNKKSLSYRNLKLYRQFFKEFSLLEKPIFDYVLNEFRNEEKLLPNSAKLLPNNSSEIGQTVSAQFKSAEKDLQIAPEKMSNFVQSGSEKMQLAELVKTPYVYEFLGLKDREVVEEADLEQALINHLEDFMLER